MRRAPRAVSLALATALAVELTVSLQAAAIPPAPSTGNCPCASASDPGARLHDGFFVRAEAGVALVHALVSAPNRSRVRALGQASSLALGATPAEGLVLGGNLWAARLDPSFVEGGREITPDDDSVKVTLARLGPFASFYPDPRRGFHLDAGLGLVLGAESDEQGNPIEPGFLGWGMALGIGQEWFVSQEFSLGVLSRAVFARISRDLDGASERWLSEGFELSLSYTYH